MTGKTLTAKDIINRLTATYCDCLCFPEVKDGPESDATHQLQEAATT